MILKKTYYSISEVSKMLNLKEHTIRFWDSKLPDLSKRDDKGKTRFFNVKQIKKLSKLKDTLKNNDSITLANEILTKNNHNYSKINYDNNDNSRTDSIKLRQNIVKIKKISNKLNKLLS